MTKNTEAFKNKAKLISVGWVASWLCVIMFYVIEWLFSLFSIFTNVCQFKVKNLSLCCYFHSAIYCLSPSSSADDPGWFPLHISCAFSLFKIYLKNIKTISNNLHYLDHLHYLISGWVWVRGGGLQNRFSSVGALTPKRVVPAWYEF